MVLSLCSEWRLSDYALLIIDMQYGNFLDPHPVHSGVELLEKVGSLIRKARSARIPIVFVQHTGGEGDPDEYGTEGWEIHPTITPASEDVIVHKETPDAFHETDLDQVLRDREINGLVVTGLQTEYCIDTTCRRACGLGYDVVLVGDTHSTWDSSVLSAQEIIEHHNNVLGGWFVELKNEADVQF
jgi:nicotinamidase-related amidase